MNSYVLTFAIGPVQGFIASARRSRDLWAGSWLLSELAKAVARDLQQNGAELVFPFVANPKDLQPKSEFSVGNKIQVVIKDKSQAEMLAIADQAKQAANAHFVETAQQVWANLGKHAHQLRENIWQAQQNDYVEVQYAWAAFSGSHDYLQASQLAAQTLAARKATRDFAPLAVNAWQAPYFGLPKSSLDGARETVLPENVRALRKKLHLSDSEQLDCLGVVKRLCGNPEQFTPITRVAAHDWIEQVKTHAYFEAVKQAYKELVQNELATRVCGNEGIYADFPYDGQFLYSSRLAAERNKADEADKSLLDNLQAALKPIWREFGEPCPYFAMLLADGDRMGELLDKAQTQENHQAITQNLSAFAQSVPEIMRQNQAQCIYSGGDDVLGFATLTDSVKCAEDLQKQFSGSLKNVSHDLIKRYLVEDEAFSGSDEELEKEIEKRSPTLSVGLAICHINTPLGTVRALAKRAEKIAKGDNAKQPRNALGITLAVRSGSTSDMRLRWDDTAALAAFGEWILAYRKGDLSSRVAYDCRDIFMRTDFAMQKNDDVNLLNKIRAAELKRMLLKARDNHGKELKKELITLLENRLKRMGGLDVENGQDWDNANDGQPEKPHKIANLDQLATELIIARWLAAKTQRDLGRENG